MLAYSFASLTLIPHDSLLIYGNDTERKTGLGNDHIRKLLYSFQLLRPKCDPELDFIALQLIANFELGKSFHLSMNKMILWVGKGLSLCIVTALLAFI